MVWAGWGKEKTVQKERKMVMRGIENHEKWEGNEELYMKLYTEGGEICIYRKSIYNKYGGGGMKGKMDKEKKIWGEMAKINEMGDKSDGKGSYMYVVGGSDGGGGWDSFN